MEISPSSCMKRTHTWSFPGKTIFTPIYNSLKSQAQLTSVAGTVRTGSSRWRGWGFCLGLATLYPAYLTRGC